MAWTITKDFLADEGAKPGTNANAIGIIGPAGTKLDAAAIIKAGKRFRMKDDDGETYYEGYAIEGPNDDGFEPLDDFGTPNAGCTSIEYWAPGKGGGWKPL